MSRKRPGHGQPGASIAGNTAYDTMAQFASVVASLVAGIFLARILGDEGRGAYVLATTFSAFIVYSFVNFGVETTAGVLAAHHPGRIAEIHTILLMVAGTAGLGLIGIVLAGHSIITAYILPGIDTRALILLAVAMPFWVYQYGCLGLLVGMKRIRARALFDFGFNLTQSFLVLVVLLFSGNDTGTAVWYLVVAYYATIIAGGTLIHQVVFHGRRSITWPRSGLLRQFVRDGFWIHVGNLGINLGQRVDQYFVQKVGNDVAAFGVYTLASGLVFRTRMLPQALSRSTYAQVCALPTADSARLVAACFRQMVAIGAIVFLAGALLSPLIPVVYTADFAPAMVPFVLLLAGRMIQNAGWMLPAFFTGHLRKPQVPLVVNWIFLPVLGIFAWLAMRHGTLAGVALATAAGYTLHTAAFVWLFLARQNHVGWKDLFLPTWDDFRPWMRLLRRIV